ncbi:Hpt domain-containing protein [Pseudochryseolinea flava]|uniref:HPt domain-containing protein n=1 Tax=Pseudochryseolinea flava TaxID=2059302 RepID=A0A364Y2A7_9BACT|nr:Hpt domain-containing protein [Pseudochryseolinea flava]RAW00413.1 hypothetical protein DQQ10_15290 [Pseudochryseolinea flava]
MQQSLDLTYLKTLMSEDENLVNRFLTIFKTQCPQQLEELRTHLLNEDWASLSTVAHSMKTQFTYLSVESLAAQAIEIETLADEGNTDIISDKIASFEKGCRSLLASVP